MPVINPNFEERSGLQPGWYTVQVVNCEQKMSKKGSPYLNWKLETRSMDSSIDGQWIFLMTALQGKGAEMFRKLVNASLDPNYISGPVDTDHILSRVLDVKIEDGVNLDGTKSPYPRVVDMAAANAQAVAAPVSGGFDEF